MILFLLTFFGGFELLVQRVVRPEEILIELLFLAGFLLHQRLQAETEKT